MDAIVLGKFTTYLEAQNTNFEHTMAIEENNFHQYQKQQQQQLLQEQEADTGVYSSLRKRRTNSIESQSTATATSAVVDFASIPPPDLVDIARIYNGPIISVNMFSKRDASRAVKSYETYREQCLIMSKKNEPQTKNSNLFLVDGRRYIDQLGMECGSDDKESLGTCHEPTPVSSLASNTTNGNMTNASLAMDNTVTGSPTRSNQAMKRYRDPSDMHRCAGHLGGHADLVSWDVIEGLYYLEQQFQ
jgi:hypothetical protein